MLLFSTTALLRRDSPQVAVDDLYLRKWPLAGSQQLRHRAFLYFSGQGRLRRSGALLGYVGAL